MPEMKSPLAGWIPDKGHNNSNANENINQQAEKSKPLTWNDYKNLLIIRYTNGGMDREAAAHYAQAEIDAIGAGNHWTGGVLTPVNDPESAIVHILENDLSETERDVYTERAGILEYDAGMTRTAAEKMAMADVLHRRPNRPATVTRAGEKAPRETTREAPCLPPVSSEPKRYEGKAAITEYTRRGIKLMPCVPVEDEPKRYRPIVSKEKWNSTATADLERITGYSYGAFWPNVPVNLFRFIPTEAGLICVDIDKGHSDGVDGESNFYRLIRARGYDPLPPLLRDLRTFPVRVETPSGGLHLYFKEPRRLIKKAKLAEGVEVFHTDPLTAAGSQKENIGYILYGDIDNAPPFPAELLEIITDNEKPYQAPYNVAYRKATHVRGDDDKELLKPRLREYIAKKEIEVTKKGGQEWMRCPLHDDASPSMQINTSGKYMGILKCHACGESLNIFGLARITAGLPEGKRYFPQTVLEIKTTLGIGWQTHAYCRDDREDNNNGN